MKSLKQIREASGGKEAYQKFFNSLLKKFGVSSPAELEGDQKKKFYDELDAGWEGDNEKPETNEKMNQDNMDPETMNQADPDEEEINAAYMKAHKMNATYDKMNGATEKGINAGYMKSSYHVNAAYHKESVNEAKKLKPGRGKAEIDINFDGDRKDIKFATTKYMIKMKPHSNGAIITGDKAKILAYLQGQDYAMDPEDIEDLYPELMESNYPKPLSIIRQNKVSSDAVEEKMVMCEHCGKMHEEGGCAQSSMDMNDMDPETKGMKEANRFSKKLNKPSKKIFDLALAAIRRNDVRGKKDQDAYVDDVAGVSLTAKEVELVKKAIQHESVDEMFSTRSIGLKGASKRSRSKARGAKLSSAELKKAEKIAKKHSGDMEKAMKEIEKIKKGSSETDEVMAMLKKANETYDYGSDKAVKAAKKKTPGQKNEGVDVDRRTKGFKDAMIRQEKAKKVREKYKKKKEAKKNQAELDARYDYDGEVDTVLAAANAVLTGNKLPEDAAANAVAHGGVDMAPNAGKKKKKKNLMARRY